MSLTKYNPFAQVLRTNFQDPQSPYQVAVTNGYEDGTNRLSSTIAQRATATNYEVTNQQFTYGQDGSLTKLADAPQGATADVQCFRYDYLHRLSSAWTPAQPDCGPDPSANALGGAALYWTSWSFDTSGNRTSQVQHSAVGDVTATPTYPAPGQPQPHAPQSISTSNGASTTENDYSYDNTGNTRKRGPSAAGQIFTYDAEGHVASITEADGKTSTYVYDADGNRILTRDPSGLTLSTGDLELHVAAGSTTAVGTRLYVYNGQTIAERNAQTGLSWMLTDAQGTAYATINAGNLAVQKRRQDPYGVPRGVTAGPWADNHGFLGGYQNTTGLTHLGARDYDPVTGTFTTADPILDGSKPAHLNAYDYGFDNPIGNTDPSGLEPLIDECRHATTPDCADFYYGAAPGPTSSGGRIKDYSTRNMGVVRACNWDQNCIWGTNNDISQKGSHPAREMIGHFRLQGTLKHCLGQLVQQSIDAVDRCSRRFRVVQQCVDGVRRERLSQPSCCHLVTSTRRCVRCHSVPLPTACQASRSWCTSGLHSWSDTPGVPQQHLRPSRSSRRCQRRETAPCHLLCSEYSRRS